MVMVKVIGVPTQVPIDGVTVMVEVIAVLPGFVPLKLVMLPVPEAPSPMEGLLFVQEYVGLPEALVNAGTETEPPLHIVMFDTEFIVGVEPTVIVYV